MPTPPGTTERRTSAGDSLWALRGALDLVAVLLPLLVLQDASRASWGFALAVLLLLRHGDSYRRRINLDVLAQLPRLLLPVAIALLFAAVLQTVTGEPIAVVSQAVLTAVTVVAGRTISYAIIRSARQRRRIAEPTLIVGAGSVGIELLRVLHEHPVYGLRPVGLVDDVDEGAGTLGRLDDLPEVVDAHHVRRVIVAFGPGAEHQMVGVLRTLVQLDVEVHVVPRFFELGLAPTGPTVEHVWGITLYRLRPAATRAAAWRSKRAVDLVLGGAALLVAMPLMITLGLAVRLTSPGPIFFRQQRIGQHGRPIDLLKFRTLEVNDDSDTTWSVEDDPRQTSVGRWLRRLSLDELPQLWNVVRGDMTLIGPRPERPHFVAEYSGRVPGYGDRHRLPVGLTGLSQVHGLRGDTSIGERARFDNLYIEHWSGWLDLPILLQTAMAVLRDAAGRTSGVEESAVHDAEEQLIAQALEGIRRAGVAPPREPAPPVPEQLTLTD